MNKEVRLIDANKLYAVCVNQAEHALENGRQEIYATMMYIAKDLLENQPTIDHDSMRPHGKWIKPTNISDLSLDVYHCSACDAVPCRVDEFTKYCPYCGAKMEDDNNE